MTDRTGHMGNTFRLRDGGPPAGGGDALEGVFGAQHLKAAADRKHLAPPNPMQDDRRRQAGIAVALLAAALLHAPHPR